MAIATENTVTESAMQMPVEVQPDDFQERLTRYKASAAVFRGMVAGGIMREEEYQKACDILANKYGLSLCSIFR